MHLENTDFEKLLFMIFKRRKNFKYRVIYFLKYNKVVYTPPVQQEYIYFEPVSNQIYYKFLFDYTANSKVIWCMLRLLH